MERQFGDGDRVLPVGNKICPGDKFCTTLRPIVLDGQFRQLSTALASFKISLFYWNGTLHRHLSVISVKNVSEEESCCKRNAFSTVCVGV